jgi:ribosome maturation protein SDO1
MGTQQTYAHEKLHLNIARLKKGGETFEVVLENIDKAIALKNGEQIDIRDAMNGDIIFKDAHKAEKISEQHMKEFLGTEDHFEAAKIIIKKGEIQLTSEQRKKILEFKTNKILNYIHQNACDPKTKLPLPLQRIELAMKEAKIHIDPADKVDYQIKKIIPKLQPILPLSFEHINLRIIIPAKYAGSAYSSVKSKHNPTNEKWLTDGSVQLELELVAGERNNLFDSLNKITNGEVQIEELK